MKTMKFSLVLLTVLGLTACNSSGGSATNSGVTNASKGNMAALGTTAPLNSVVFSNPNRRLAHVGVKSVLQVQSMLPIANIVLSPATTGTFVNGGNDTYTFTPSSALTSNTSYSFILMDANGIALPDTYHFDTQTDYTIFDSASNSNAEFMGNGAKGVAGFDQTCTAAAQQKGWPEPYKAILGSWGGTANGFLRTICVNDSTDSLSNLENRGLCGGSYSKNWILQPNSSYFNLNGKLIQHSDSYGVLPFNWSNSIYVSDGNKHAFTGFNANWSVLTGTSTLTSGDLTCNGWTSASSSLSTWVGFHDLVDSKVLNGGGSYTKCDSTYQVACVQQALTALVQPADPSSAPLNTPVEIQFAYQVNTASIISGNNIRVVDKTTNKVVQVTISESANNDGTTTASGATNFILTQKAQWLNGHTYTVYINSTEAGVQGSIVDGVGIAVQPQEFTFTALSDAASPTMISPPVGQRTNVPENSVITLQFSSDVDPSTITTSSISISEDINSTPTQAKPVQQVVSTEILFHILFSYGVYTLVTLTPDKNLDDHAKVMVKLNNIKNKDGTPVTDSRWQFFTPNPVNTVKMIIPLNRTTVALYEPKFVIKYPETVASISSLLITDAGGNSVNSTSKVGVKGSSDETATRVLGTLKADTDYQITGTVYYTSGGSVQVSEVFHTANAQALLKYPDTATNVPLNTTWEFKFANAIDQSKIKISDLSVSDSWGNYPVTAYSVGKSGHSLRVATGQLNPGRKVTATFNVPQKNSQNIMTANATVQTVEVGEVDFSFIIYEATNSGEGYTGNIGGINGADNICNIDNNKPIDPVGYRRLYRAILADIDLPGVVNGNVTARYACEIDPITGLPNCGGVHQINWPLMVNTHYYQPTPNGDPGILIGTTGADATFAGVLQNQIRVAPLPLSAMTGMEADWSAANPLDNCGHWQENGEDYWYTFGRPEDLNVAEVISAGTSFCDYHATILCAQYGIEVIPASGLSHLKSND